jgi:GH24 family phage-related lysozyme (muramidase)
MSYEQLVDTCVVHLKKYEGFKSTPYFDASGNKCIGYGHLIKNGEEFNTLTRQQASNLLKKDFLRIVSIIQKDTDLSGSKLLAVSLFSYNMGIGYFYKSSLYKAILKNDPIDKYIIKYSYYYKGKKPIKSSKLTERRQFELWLYNYD